MCRLRLYKALSVQEEVYVKPSPGFGYYRYLDAGMEHFVMRRMRSLYGLRMFNKAMLGR